MPGPRSYILEDTNGDGRFNEGDDLKEDVKETLADYLSLLTITPPTQNAYSLPSYSYDAPSFNKVTDRTPSIVTAGNETNRAFIDDVTEVARAYLEGIGQGDFGDGDDPLLGLVDKNLRAAKHGELLGSIEGDGSSEVEQKVSEVLLNNRFNPGGGSPYIKDGDYSSGTPKSRAFGRTQKLMGEYVTDDGKNAQPYSVEDLQKIAMSLLLIGTGRLQADDDPNAEDSGTILTTTGGEGIQLATVRVGNEKLGAGDLEARNVFGGAKLTNKSVVNAELRDPEIPAKAGFFDFDTPGASYGQMFSHLEMFSPFGAYSPSPIALLFPQFITIAASTAAVGLIISLLTGDLGFPRSDKVTDEDVLPLGRNKSSVGPLGGFGAMMKKLMQIPATQAPLLPSIFVGLLWFQVASIFGAAGFVVTVQRGVARDTVAFMDMLANDDLFSGGFISDLGAIGIIIDALLNSKFFRFTVTMAVMGDKIITGHWTKKKTYNGGLGWANMDEAPNNALYRVAKSRKFVGKKGLTWSAGNIPSAYILPSAFKIALSAGPQVDADGALAGFLSNASLNAKLVDPATFGDENPGSRLPGNLVEMIENQLEVEYVPFYFHDLRTNEIIAFHAFLQNISDSYAANWNAQTGIGRVEPAYIYGGTTRSIGMQFLIAATGPDDYDEMWYKINKLTTLVYPQFSRGRVLVNEELKFVQPFSQVQTASPLVRIRLGDLFKSNYSKLGLARLFGLGQGESAFQPDPTVVETGALTRPLTDAEKRYYAFIRIYAARDPENPFDFVGYTVGDVVIIPRGQRINISPIIPGTGKTKNNVMLDVEIQGTVTLPALLAPPGDDGTAGSAAQTASMGTPAAGAGAGAEPPELNIDIKYLVMLDGAANDMLNAQFNPTIPGAYKITISHEALVLEPVWATFLADLMAGIIPNPFAPPPEATGAFLDAENNAIVRSFESSRGRGLAGAITSMDFDWNEKTWVTERVGSKAPMFCSVTLQFNPIHDITPGLDSDGFNRAPIYNVGKVMNAVGGDPYNTLTKNEAVAAEQVLQKTTTGTSVQGLVDKARDEA